MAKQKKKRQLEENREDLSEVKKTGRVLQGQTRFIVGEVFSSRFGHRIRATSIFYTENFRGLQVGLCPYNDDNAVWSTKNKKKFTLTEIDFILFINQNQKINNNLSTVLLSS